MSKDTGIVEKADAFSKMEKNDLFKYRSVSKNIDAMVKSLDEQEKNDSLESKDENEQV